MFEIGLRDKLPWSTVNITLWMSKTDNQLNRFYINGISEAISANILETTRWGADVGLTQQFGKFTFTENYSWLRGYSDYNDWGRRFMEENRKNTIDFTRSGLVKVPQHSVSLQARYDFNENLSADVKYSFFGGYNNFLEDAAKQEDGTVGSYSLVDVSARWKPFKNLKFTAACPICLTSSTTNMSAVVIQLRTPMSTLAWAVPTLSAFAARTDCLPHYRIWACLHELTPQTGLIHRDPLPEGLPQWNT